MVFDFWPVKETMERDSIKPADMAKLFEISVTYLYMLEKGRKEPSLRLIRKMAGVIGVPVGKLLHEETGEIDDDLGANGSASIMAGFNSKLECERNGRLQAEKRSLASERAVEHLQGVISLHVRFADIKLSKSLSEDEKTRKIKELAKEAIHGNTATFGEALTVFRVTRSTLKNWLREEKLAYKCKFAEGGEIMASTPGEAGLCLRCFDCKELESRGCEGHGDEKRPANIIVLFARLRANGVLQQEELSRILGKHYGIPLTPHEISEMIYRYKHGMPIPEGIFYLDNAGRRR
ncbi:MAG: helix-turn-helix transcriptional regulator [Synergistaceae bacterium]|jgi:transcriptional regulator with XRE-family HTH domain|nr:helix-turn-helix transcriptional regulator [Synergistaceae bacterium]